MEVVQWFLTSWWRSAQRCVSLQYRSKISRVIFLVGGVDDDEVLALEETGSFSLGADSIRPLSGEPGCSSSGRDGGEGAIACSEGKFSSLEEEEEESVSRESDDAGEFGGTEHLNVNSTMII